MSICEIMRKIIALNARFLCILCLFRNPKKAEYTSFCFRSSFPCSILRILTCAHYIFLPFFVILAGCDYSSGAPEKEEKCTFRVKAPDDGGKFNHVMFFLMYKMSELPDFSHLYDQDDASDFSLNQSCRQVLETILGKM